MKETNKKGAMHADQSTAKLQNTTENIRHLNINTNNRALSTVEPHQTILGLISTGENNAIHLCELVSLTKMKNREVRKCIEQLKRNGEVIVSSVNGYFKPETVTELKKYINQETHRAKSIFYTLKSARKLIQQLEEVE